MSGWHNPRIMERFQSQFGKTNYVASLGDFDVVVVSFENRVEYFIYSVGGR